MQVLVHHADALVDVLDGALQQGAVELQHLAGFVGDAHHVFKLHLSAFDGRLDHCAGRRGAKHTRQQPLGVLDPVAVGVLVGVEALALAIGETNEALSRPLFAHKARSQLEQIVDLYRQQRPVAGPGAALLTDEAACLPVLRDACARQDRDPGEQDEITRQGQHHTLGQWGDRQVQRVAVQPGKAGEQLQRPSQAVGGDRQHQGVEP